MLVATRVRCVSTGHFSRAPIAARTSKINLSSEEGPSEKPIAVKFTCTPTPITPTTLLSPPLFTPVVNVCIRCRRQYTPSAMK